MDQVEWCDHFVRVWTEQDPEADRDFVLLVARRSFDHEGSLLEPDVTAREHLALLRRIKQATSRP